MADDLRNRGPADRARISVHESWELEWWCQDLHCTADELRAAVAAVGVSVEAVRAYLRRR